MTTLEERQKRIDDAIALREPDRIPITAGGQCYAVYNAGFTVADVTYDFEKYEQAAIKYLLQYEPDAAGIGITTPGMGPVFELMQPKNMIWPGAPGARISDNSTHQFIEYPTLLEEDMSNFVLDYSGWLLEKGLPAVSGLLEPLKHWRLGGMGPGQDVSDFASMVSTPESKNMIETLWKINDMRNDIMMKTMELNRKFEEMGFPVTGGGFALVPFDNYSDHYRGTVETFLDFFEHRDVIEQFCDRNIEYVLNSITMQAQFSPGKWVFMPLHKGMDGFMDDEQYENLYWKYLRRMILHIIDVGMVPFVYTEGLYNSRVKFLKDVPPGKVVYSFETADAAYVKKELGGVACLQGFMPTYLLHYGTKQEVIDECKRLIDILAPGGGHIFTTGAGFDHAKPENIEAMFDTVKTYGKK